MPTMVGDIMKAYCHRFCGIGEGPGACGTILQCASHPGTIARIPGISRFADTQIDQLAERIRMIIGSFPVDGATTTLSNAPPDMFTAARVPGMPASNNDTERSIRYLLVVDRRRVIFPDWRAARNFATLRTFAATCEKNGISAYQATIRMARDPTWSIFTDGNTHAHLRGRRGAQGRTGGIRGARPGLAASPFPNRPERRTDRCRMAWNNE